MATVATLTKPKRDGLGAMLKEGGLVKQKAVEITCKFATAPDGPLDKLTVAASQENSLVIACAQSTPVEAELEVHGQELQIVPVTGGEVVPVDPDDEPKSPNTSDDVLAEEEQFKEAMREYEDTAEPKYKTGIDPDAEHSVTQLWKVIDDEVAKYHSKDKKGLWGKIRLAFRKLGDGNQAVQGWLGLLPTESHYLSVVCGGLKLIIHVRPDRLPPGKPTLLDADHVKAAARMRKVAKDILEALCKIPVIMSSTRRVLNIFKESRELRQKSKALYKSILGGLGHMLEYLRRGTARKGFMAGLKQENFESDLLDNWIGNITKDRDGFNEEAEMCHKEAVQKLQKMGDKNAKDIQQQIKGISVVIEAAREEDRRAHQAFLDGMELLGMTIHGMFRSEMESFKVDLRRTLVDLLAANPKVTDYSWSLNKRLDAADDVIARRPQRRASVVSIVRTSFHSPTPQETPHRQRRALLSRLDYDPDAVATDVETNYRLGSDLSIEDQERSLFVIQSTKLADWVWSRHSTSLVVNGGARRVTRKSALSFACARIVYVLDQIQAPLVRDTGIPAIISLHFFCGQHVRREQSWESPAGVVSSLLAQLLTQCREADLSRATKMGDFDGREIEEVWARFEKVLGRLPAGATVFCVVDALSFYVDDDETAEDAEFLVRRLVELASEGSKKRPVFRLLLTAPARLRVGEEVLRKSVVLSVPATLPKTGGFTAMKWKRGVGKHLDALGG
ncbi:hypothetical protein CONLIGDRAFT_648639 [Coniochaeta ligniaria NRRL 30616]|uniref:Nephrocystin 3-like N-terminal domain-containing protein n=1 Tax=Coniochaeta ligniaria NRRL 30616 TaxID=1408157 RepID=A0A1J7JA99_9PEZI|nr:hypothetical protein CONLIGDRAFT_648639 [Coniochaeta ligniaria NRRL 30616]